MIKQFIIVPLILFPYSLFSVLFLTSLIDNKYIESRDNAFYFSIFPSFSSWIELIGLLGKFYAVFLEHLFITYLQHYISILPFIGVTFPLSR